MRLRSCYCRLVLLGILVTLASCSWGDMLRKNEKQLAELEEKLDKKITAYELLSKDNTEQGGKIEKIIQQMADLSKSTSELYQEISRLSQKIYCDGRDVAKVKDLVTRCQQTAQGCRAEELINDLRLLLEIKNGFQHAILRFSPTFDLDPKYTRLEKVLSEEKIELLKEVFVNLQAPNIRILLIGLPRNTHDTDTRVISKRLADLKGLLSQHFSALIEKKPFFELAPNDFTDQKTQNDIEDIYHNYLKLFKEDKRGRTGEPRDTEPQIVVWVFSIWC